MSELPGIPLRVTSDDIDRVPDALVSRSEPPRVNLADDGGNKPSARWIVGGALATCVFAAIIATVALGGKPIESGPPIPMKTLASASALTLSMIKLSVVTLRGSWTEDDGPLLSADQESWTGSAVIVGGIANARPGVIYVLTNSHCLALSRLASSDYDGVPEVKSYAIDIVFQSGQTRRATRMADTRNSGLDLAMLEVEVGDLKDGVDYIAAAIPDSHKGKETDPVVALGSPSIGGGEVLSGTFTTGNISAFRSFAPGSGSEQYKLVQHTAAINPGNSGGALFLNNGEDEYSLLGINTFVLKDLQGLSFAFHIAEAIASRTQYVWVPCDAAGAVELLHLSYNDKATLAK